VRRAAHWHHWLAHQHLRVYVRTQRLSDEDAATLLRRLLHDRRNYSPRPASNATAARRSTTVRTFTFEDVPPAAFAFAAELGPRMARAAQAHLREGWPVIVRVRAAHGAQAEMLPAIRAVALRHPGEHKLQLRVGERVLTYGDRVDVSRELVADLETLDLTVEIVA
jgi:hypothetical protein